MNYYICIYDTLETGLYIIKIKESSRSEAKIKFLEYLIEQEGFKNINIHKIQIRKLDDIFEIK
jgi:hypothetical protein